MSTETTTELITDEQSLSGATIHGGRSSIQTYDDGFGPLWLLRNSMGITGIIRAQSWQDAYSIAEDEFFPAADESQEDLIKEYGENFMDDGAFQETYGFRPNGGMYQKDLNGEWLDRLTPALLAELEITLQIETPTAD